MCVVRSGAERDTYAAHILVGSATLDVAPGRRLTVSSFSYPDGTRTAVVNASSRTQEYRLVNYGPGGAGGGTEALSSVFPGEVGYVKEMIPYIGLGGSPGGVKAPHGIAVRHELAPAGVKP